MGSTSNYNKKAIKCLMSLYRARKLVEAYKQQKAEAAMSRLERSECNNAEFKGREILKEIETEKVNEMEKEISEINPKLKVNQLANGRIDNYERSNIIMITNFRSDWNERSKIREAKKQTQFKSEHMPVKMTITSKLQKPHRVYSQTCSLDEFNFVFDHLRMGSTSSYNKKAIICLMSLYHARKLVEADKHQKAVAAVSNLERTDNSKSDERILSGSESLGNEQYSKLSEEKILSLGGKSAPSLIVTKSMFQTMKSSSRISDRL
jgi:hypothetical protein